MSRSLSHITDQALLRYLERVKGVDVNAARREITVAVAVAEDHDGATGVIRDGFVYKLNGSTVVTVVPHCEPNIRGRKGRS